WCTGECRAGAMVGDSLSDKDGSRVKHLYGGCWDGTETKRNTEDTLVMKGTMNENENECRLERMTQDELKKYPDFRNLRPWIVYPGSVQVGTYK
ncbi:MAG: hypothetical protein AABZ40_04315, partial [Thermodesulfobacteriota bacterium]